MCDWLLTNIERIEATALDLSITGKRFRLYTDKVQLSSFQHDGINVSFLVDGYILPRFEYMAEYSRFAPAALIEELYKTYRLELIHFIKGNFVLLLIVGESFYIFNDPTGIKKFFYYTRAGNFIFSNRLAALSSGSSPAVDAESLAIYSLTNHFIDGLTFLKDFFYSKPAAAVSFNAADGFLKFGSYWDCSALLDDKKRKIDEESFTGKFVNIIKAYLQYLAPQEVTLTLTGGLDSRLILAALLHLGIQPRTFTYGHPHSLDAVTAGQIARACNLDHQIIYVKPSAAWFSQLAGDIIAKGNSIIHIHRAHRLFAALQQGKEGGNSAGTTTSDGILVGGYMGGELIRNFFYDGIITSNFTKQWISTQAADKRQALIYRHLEENNLKARALDIARIENILASQKYSGSDVTMNEFFLTFLISSHLHHAQDVNLFFDYIKYPAALFLDIDCLELIFSSPYHFMNTKKHGNAIHRKLNRLHLYCSVISRLAPDLARIPVAKKGYYTPAECVKDNSWVFLGKRLVRKTLSKQHYPPNFSLGDWMKEYVAQQLPLLQQSPTIGNFIDVPILLQRFAKGHHQSHEGYWRTFTNPVFFNRLCEFYLEEQEGHK